MGDKTAIEWTDATWNPIRGCSRVSEGCRNCYAERVAARFSGPGQPYEGLARIGRVTMTDGQRTHTTAFRWTGKVRFVEEALTLPLRWKAPRRIFVNSMSDLFHEKVPDEWIARIFAVMALAPQHTFQVLTKRPERMRAYLSAATLRHCVCAGGGCPYCSDSGRMAWSRAPFPNVWLGVSVEDQATADARIPLLLQTPAAIRWVSYEPALGPVDFMPWLMPCEGLMWLCERCGFRLGRAVLNAVTGHFSKAGGPDTNICPNDGSTLVPDRRLDWLVVGGESGPGARPFDLAWARTAMAQCLAAGVPVFVKQLGARPYDSSCGPGCDVGEYGDQHDPDEHEIRLRDRKGGDMQEWPEDLRVREFPR